VLSSRAVVCAVQRLTRYIRLNAVGEGGLVALARQIRTFRAAATRGADLP
jgi:hypothetical protein